jgi:hypothetical protein
LFLKKNWTICLELGGDTLFRAAVLNVENIIKWLERCKTRRSSADVLKPDELFKRWRCSC